MYSEIAANKRKTVFLMFGFILLVSLLSATIAWYFQDFYISAFAITFAAIYTLWGYYGADKAALSIHNAVQIEKADSPRLWRIVENLSITTGIPMPKVYVINDAALNAFATGRDPKHASVAITTGLLEALDDNELEGVMAHEIGHIQNYDIRVSLISFGLVAAISILSDMILRTFLWGGLKNDNRSSSPYMYIVVIVALILIPIIATLIKFAVSRKREYLADATGALTTRYPEGLASALQKIENNGSIMRKQSTSTAHLFISNPLKDATIGNLFSTHPPIEDRIRKLQAMESHA